MTDSAGTKYYALEYTDTAGDVTYGFADEEGMWVADGLEGTSFLLNFVSIHKENPGDEPNTVALPNGTKIRLMEFELNPVELG